MDCVSLTESANNFNDCVTGGGDPLRCDPLPFCRLSFELSTQTTNDKRVDSCRVGSVLHLAQFVVHVRTYWLRPASLEKGHQLGAMRVAPLWFCKSSTLLVDDEIKLARVEGVFEVCLHLAWSLVESTLSIVEDRLSNARTMAVSTHTAESTGRTWGGSKTVQGGLT